MPCLTKPDNVTVPLCTVPLHGDQLFEERARNAKWTFRNGNNEYERFDAINTEFADWHAKYTLYKISPTSFCQITLNHQELKQSGCWRFVKIMPENMCLTWTTYQA